ncbi:hypothetical protein N7493_010251 [Penicillium malachiteum]|uniref:Cytochrome P450 n=1 Tax=Penicillium malachiteum TaxID=1324776 RepID=A0AAD6HCE8_9EURO|nr:hypothetical protein N7493_010251 [Penicillium malachiteum]
MAGSLVWPLLGALLVYFLLRWKTDSRLKHIPIVRFYKYLPDMFNRMIFYPWATWLIDSGYQKYKDAPFRILTGDGELVVLPVKYLPEMKHFPPTVVSSLDAQYENALGDYTNIIINSALPSKTVRRRLTPNIARVIPWVIDELHYAFNTAIPECEDDWVSIKPHQMFVRLVARATSRVLAGDVLRRNEEWLNTASSYPVNVGITILILRPFPTWLRPLIAPFLPSVRQMKAQLHFVKSLFIPMINERWVAKEKALAENDPGYVPPDDFLQWMLDMAVDEKDKDAEILAHHMLLLMSLAVVHTSSMAMCHALYDLLLMPEYLGPLREEINETLPGGWDNATKSSLDNQVRMDSFLKESQRFGPPGELSFHRIVMKSFTLSDGLFVPEGTHICFAAGAISKDPAFVANPLAFDGFRWCQNPKDRNALETFTRHGEGSGEKQQIIGAEQETTDDSKSAPILSTSNKFVDITAPSMHFGAGFQACPGRHFASCSIKAVFSKIIMDYDFKYEDGRDNRKPASMWVGEQILPNTSTPVMFRKRAIAA